MPFVGKETLQLAGLEHLADDIAAADELSLHVQLRNRRPVGVFLDSLAQLVGSEDIDALVVDAEVVEDLHDLTREAAQRLVGGALHEEHDVVGLDLVVDEIMNSGHRSVLSIPGSRPGAPVSEYPRLSIVV